MAPWEEHKTKVPVCRKWEPLTKIGWTKPKTNTRGLTEVQLLLWCKGTRIALRGVAIKDCQRGEVPEIQDRWLEERLQTEISTGRWGWHLIRAILKWITRWRSSSKIKVKAPQTQLAFKILRDRKVFILIRVSIKTSRNRIKRSYIIKSSSTIRSSKKLRRRKLLTVYRRSSSCSFWSRRIRIPCQCREEEVTLRDIWRPNRRPTPTIQLLMVWEETIQSKNSREFFPVNTILRAV